MHLAEKATGEQLRFPAFSFRVDYADWPPNFRSYQRSDQQRLALRRWLILNATEAERNESTPIQAIFGILAHSGRLPQSFVLTSTLYFDRSTGILSGIGYYADDFDPAEYIAVVVRCWVALEGDQGDQGDQGDLDTLQMTLRRVAAGNLQKMERLAAQLNHLLENAASELDFMAQLGNIVPGQTPPDETD